MSIQIINILQKLANQQLNPTAYSGWHNFGYWACLSKQSLLLDVDILVIKLAKSAYEESYALFAKILASCHYVIAFVMGGGLVATPLYN